MTNRFVCAVLMSTAALSACSTSSPTSPTRLPAAALTEPASAVASGDFTATTTSAPAPSAAAANYEQKFMTGMIDHHAMAIEMAEICLTKAVHEELRQLCESIIAAQSREIRQMQRWLQDWYGISYEPEMSKSGERELARLSALSGAEFEIAFMEMMIRHHQAAVREGQACIDRAYHRQLIQLCENIIATQSAEIAQMQEWLCAWYGRCA